MNAFSIALQSGSILLREGLEAMLVIAALAAFLHKANAGPWIRWLYAGAVTAIAASIAAAVVFEVYFNGMHDDRMEAVVLAIAAVLMFYMSGWLFLRQNPQAWTKELKDAAEKAIGRGTAMSLAALAFLAVFREGAETILFLHATARTSGGWSAGLVGGLAGATVLLVGLYVAMQWLALRLPLRPLFLVTSAFLFVMGLRFVGGAIQECQEQVLVPLHAAPLPAWLVMLGFNPSWEAIAAQAVIGAVAVAGTLGLLRLRRAEA
jgi:high-affinity iron transporter